MNLSQNWKTQHQRYSVKALAVGAVLTVAWNLVPHELREAFPEWAPRAIGAAIFVFGLIGTYLAQPGLAGNALPTDTKDPDATH
jgi:hypothetical protein